MATLSNKLATQDCIYNVKAVMQVMEKDNCFGDEFRWDHLDGIILGHFAHSRSCDGYSFTVAHQYAFDREALCTGTILEAEDAADWSLQSIAPGSSKPSEKLQSLDDNESFSQSPLPWPESPIARGPLATPELPKIPPAIKARLAQLDSLLERERRIPDITVFLTRKYSEPIHRPILILEVKPLKKGEDPNPKLMNAMRQVLEQAQFALEKNRDIPELYLIVVVGGYCQYMRVNIQYFTDAPLPQHKIHNPVARRKAIPLEQAVGKTSSIFEVLTPKRDAFSVNFTAMCDEIFGRARQLAP